MAGISREYEVAFKLGAELESSFMRSFNNASTDFKKLQNQIQDITSGKNMNGSRLGNLLNPFRNNLKQTRQDMKTTGDAGEQLISGLKKVGGAVAGAFAIRKIAGIGKDLVNTYADFEQGMANAYSVMAPEEVSKFSNELEKLAIKMGADTKYNAEEAARGIEELIKAGVEVKDVLDGGLQGALSLATAGELELADAAEIASTALNAFRDDNISVQRAADLLAGAANASATSVSEMKFGLSQASAVAASVGLSFEDTTTALAAFAQSGLKGSDAGTSLKTMLMRLQPSTNEAYAQFNDLGLLTLDTAKAMDYLSKHGIKPVDTSVNGVTSALAGYFAKMDGAKKVTGKYFKQAKNMADANGWIYSSFYDASGSLKNMDEIAGILRDSMSDLNDMQRQAAMNKMFGSDAIRAGSILFKEGAEGIDKMNEAMNKITATDVAAMKMDTLKGSIEEMNGAIETAKITLGGKLAPQVRAVVDSIANQVPKVMERFERNYDAMTNSPIWNNSDWIGKVQIAWDRIVSKPFVEWWTSKGKAQVSWVASEIGKTIGKIVKGLMKESFSFNGASSWLAAGALAIPGVKVGKGVAGTIGTLKSLGRAGTTAAEGAETAAKSAGVFRTAISLLSNPVGAAIAGVGLLAGGWYVYKRRQEDARQALIHMGDKLKESGQRFEEAKSKAQITNDLIWQYRDLSRKIADGSKSSGDLAANSEKLAGQQERQKEVVEKLQALYPNTLSNYDVENGKIQEKLGLLQQESKAEMDLAKLRLEKDIAEGNQKLPDTVAEIQRLQEKTDAALVRKDDIDVAKAAFKEYAAEYERIMMAPGGEGQKKKLEELAQKANEVGKAVGLIIDEDKLGYLTTLVGELGSEQADLLGNLVTDSEDLQKAKDSYQALYDKQVELIELNLGGTLEEYAQKFGSLADEGKAKFNESITAAKNLGDQMSLIPSEKKINIEFLYSQSGQYMPKAPKTVQEITTSLLPKQFQGPQYADGDIVNKPHVGMFGEAGPEAFIPINNKPRSHAILDRVNKMMGRDTLSAASASLRQQGQSDSSVVINNNPSLVIQGSADADTVSKIEEALRKNNANLGRMIDAHFRNKGRLSMGGTV
ncbi:phage tail tape measure protein [Paenibacillus sp. NPDC057934]|uniref:phage tail tape measure protein n=1 Tax=Paenibacillus sp. NPDC057934 TaxID=3346282 RepID=UPI0036DE3A69